jgi:streptomycin 6-kinase
MRAIYPCIFCDSARQSPHITSTQSQAHTHLFDHGAAKGRREGDRPPALVAEILRRLIQLRREIKHVHGAVRHHEGIDFKVCEIQLNKGLVGVEDKGAQQPVV